MSKSSICTLYEKNYHYGVAALVNSLAKSGFRGDIWVGFRGKLPTWIKTLEQDNTKKIPSFKINDSTYLNFIDLNHLDIKIHLARYKPTFMLDLLNNYIDKASNLFYFDPDITIKCHWSFFEDWVEHGIALCEDVNGYLPWDSPLRNKWRTFIGNKNLLFSNTTNAYYNSGFIGLKKESTEFLKSWEKIIKLSLKLTESFSGLEYGDRSFIFNSWDQDCLNIAHNISKLRFSTMDNSAMDLSDGGYVMSHAIGSNKPWCNCFILNVLFGITPTTAQKNFWKNQVSPIKSFNQFYYYLKKMDLRLASFISRFYSRK